MTTLFYRELPPPPDLEHLVLSFWEFTAASHSAAPIMHEIFPDGCISVVYRRNAKIGIEGFSINDLHPRSVIVPVFGGDTFWGARLSPAACARVIGSDPASVRKVIWTGGEGVFGIVDKELFTGLTACKTLEDAADVYSARLNELGIQSGDLDTRVLEAVSIIEEARGETRIAALAADLGLSVRQFERRFKKSAGLPPKRYARTRRFRAAAAVLATGEAVNWAMQASEMGFADQAHLAREFSYLTGRSPRSFAEKIRAIDHGTLV